ncbi:chemotaxis protein CheX [Clostridium algifaecis]|uniref:Chemotaxis protein CheX n=1 Tax=Clostridium algifaecis TaxID=1472040 RepID=A0ABS4KNA3_9CLOT|nr:chemotaxis protein CheX [Clostridium algifaecis]MBP2031513.1 chemotaxis protein CheX [Clostridium algifaecis]
MDVRYINPFLDAFVNVMPQLGIDDLKKGKISIKGKTISSIGVLIIIGIVGDLRGNIIYGTTIENAKNIASRMMMGAPVKELDEIAQSAISELTNMLTANACTSFSEEGINIDISTPTLMYGNFKATANSDKVLCVEMIINGAPFEVNISIEKSK